MEISISIFFSPTVSFSKGKKVWKWFCGPGHMLENIKKQPNSSAELLVQSGRDSLSKLHARVPACMGKEPRLCDTAEMHWRRGLVRFCDHLRLPECAIVWAWCDFVTLCDR